MKRVGNWFYEADAEENLVAATANLLLAAGVCVTRTSLQEALRTHPRFPSLAAASDSLSGWGVETQGFRLQTELLAEVPLPCLAALEEDGGRVVTITHVDGGRVTHIDPRAGSKTSTLDEFARSWNGTVLAIQVGEEAGEKDCRDHRRIEKRAEWADRLQRVGAVWTALGVTALIVWSLRGRDPLLLALLLAKLVGTALCAILVTHYLSSHDRVLRRVCRDGRGADCRQVLDAPAARLFGWIPMADVGLVYFAAGWLALFLGALAEQLPGVVTLLGVLAASAVPYAVFSVYYQARVLRKWCRVCLAVQALFLIEVGASVRTAMLHGAPTPAAWALVTLAFLGVAAAWATVRALLETADENRASRYRYKRLLRNPAVVSGLLGQEYPVPSPAIAGDVVMGEPKTPYELLVITHPQCRFCGTAHGESLELLRRFPEAVSLRFRFLCGESTGLGREIAFHCSALQIENRGDEAAALLEHWFRSDFEPRDGQTRWPLRRPADSGPRAERALAEGATWAKASGVEGTPAFFVNGRKLSSELWVSDLAVVFAQSASDESLPAAETAAVCQRAVRVEIRCRGRRR